MANLPSAPERGGRPPFWDINPANGAGYTFEPVPGFIQTTTGEQNDFGRQQSQDVFNQQQAFLNALSANYGLNPYQAQIFGQQQDLANQFGQLAAGQGSSLAQTMLAEKTGQNIQQQAGLMAGARGAHANPGLVARQAALQGGAIQQQAAGQAASLRAQEQLNAMANLANQQRALAGLATQGQAQQQGAIAQLAGQGTNIQSQLENAINSQNQQRISKYGADQQVAINSANNSQQLLGSALGAAGTLGAAALMGGAGGGAAAGAIGGPIGMGIGAGIGALASSLHDGGVAGDAHPLDAFVSGRKLSSGGKVEGQAQVKGDSAKNDTVPAMLSPGEIVIPRSHVGGPDQAAAFLNGLMGWNLKTGKRAA